jgi:hypothetical protein
MIGPTALSVIRQELQRALTATGDDPIRWLEERMSSPETESSAVCGESEILQSLRRILETTETAKRRKQQGGTKK